MKGYVLRTYPDGTQEFVRWDQADTVPGRPAKRGGLRSDPFVGQAEMEAKLKADLEKDLPPIVKRTPQQRLEDMWQRLLHHALDAYRMTGEFTIHPDLLAMVQNEYWKRGQPVTQDVLKGLAGRLLLEAENKMNLKARLRGPTLTTEAFKEGEKKVGFKEKVQSLSFPRKMGQSEHKPVIDERDGTVGGKQVEHWDGSQDAVVRPKTLGVKTRVNKEG